MSEILPDTLYDDDILAWSEQQAALLRRAAAGERVNGLDWANLIEEIDSVGRSELHACSSLLLQGLRHVMKCAAWPDSDGVRHWRSEVVALLPQAKDTFAPSMRQRLDLDEIYRRALDATREDQIRGRNGLPLPEACPFSLDELLVVRPDLDALIARLGPVAPPSPELGSPASPAPSQNRRRR